MSSEKLKIVFEFIQKNQGCNTQQIVEGVNDSVSRMVVFKILDELLKDGLIIFKEFNRRDKNYFSNENNEYVKIKNDIDEFKQKYYDLLEKLLESPTVSSLKKASDKNDFSLNKNEKLRILENLRTLPYEYKIAERIFDTIRLGIRRIEFDYSILYDSIYNPDFYKDINNGKPSTLNDSEQLAKQILKTSSQVSKVLDKYYILVKRSGYGRIHLWTVYIYLLFTHFFNLRCIGVWPAIIQDKKILNDLNKLVYEEILEINNKIFTFFSNAGGLMLDINEVIKNFNSPLLFIQKEVIMQMICDYKSLNLGKEIEEIVKLLNQVSFNEKNFMPVEFFLEKTNEFCKEVLKMKSIRV